MQFIVISHQLFEILLGVLLGTALGTVYDLLRFLRSFWKKDTFQIFLVNFFDILFSIFGGAVYCVFIYYASNGRFRWFTAFALIFGYVVYSIGPSRLIRPMLFWIADRICDLAGIIVFPIKSVFGIVGKSFYALRGKLYYRKQKIVTENLKLQLCDCVKLLEDGDKL